MAPPIPDRWIPYKACGKVIEGTRFICFKVPLRKAVQVGKSEIKEIWDISALLAKIPNLGAVIDLTNTNRYYDPRELQAAGILHRKILMPGRIVPPEQQVQVFMDTVDEFLGKDCEFLIGVHCTHGLNRTGYMVCRYMRDRLNISAKSAIKRFEKARGYEIERANYIADLVGKKPPPPDLGKSTKVKPIGDTTKDFPEREDEDNPKTRDDNDRTRRKDRSKASYSDWRSEPRDKQDSLNWRSGPSEGSWRNDSKREDTRWDPGNNRYSWRRTRTDSERSYDYRYDY